MYPSTSSIRSMRAGSSTLVVLTSTSEIHSFSKETGDMLWSCVTKDAFDTRYVSDQDDDGQDDLIVVAKDRVELWSGDLGTKLWTFDSEEREVRDVALIENESILVATYDGNVVTTQKVSLRNGVTIGNPKRQEIGDLVDGPIVVADRYLVMLARESKFHVLDLESGSAVVQQLKGDTITSFESFRPDAPILRLNGGDALAYLDLDSNEIRELKNDEGTANDVVVSSETNDLFVVSASTNKIVVRDARTDKIVTETSSFVLKDSGTVKSVFSQLYRKKSERAPRFRFLLTTSDGTNTMISGEETMWLEEGGLASVREVLFTDRPGVSKTNVNVMPSLYDRLQMQLDTLISSVPSFTLSSETSNDNAFFGFDRVALLRSQTGAIYALETSDGTQLWKTFVSGAKRMFLSNEEKRLQVLCEAEA